MNYTVHKILQARILGWVAFPFSRGSSQPNNWTQVSHIADGFFTSWATREAQGVGSLSLFQWIFPTHELNWRSPAVKMCTYTHNLQLFNMEPLQKTLRGEFII